MNFCSEYSSKNILLFSRMVSNAYRWLASPSKDTKRKVYAAVIFMLGTETQSNPWNFTILKDRGMLNIKIDFKRNLFRAELERVLAQFQDRLPTYRQIAWIRR